jgi:hypothetical protein
MSENTSEEMHGEAESFLQWEGIIRDHEADFWKVGEALINIRVNELWREEHSGKPYTSWEDYVEKAWGYVSRAKRLMQAAKLHTKLAEAGMSDDEFRRIASHEAQAKKLSRVASLSKEETKKFVESVAEKGDDADFDDAAETLNEIKPPKIKPPPAELQPKERRKAMNQALDRAKTAFNTKIEAIFEEFGDPEAVDDWLRKFADEIIRQLSK